MGGDQACVQRYLEKLTGRNGVAIEELTSAQRARFASWAKEKGIDLKTSVKSAKLINSEVGLVLPTEGDGGTLSSVGIDIQHISELSVPDKDWKSSPELLHIFTKKEIAYSESKVNALETLVGIFAAKEAVVKTFEVNPFISLSSVEIDHDQSGKPISAYAEVSISHSQEYAVAMAFRRVSARPLETGRLVDIDTVNDPAINKLNNDRNKYLIHCLLGLCSGIVGAACFIALWF